MTIEVDAWWTTLARTPADTSTTACRGPGEWKHQGTSPSKDRAIYAARAAIAHGSRLEYAVAYVRREVVEIVR